MENQQNARAHIAVLFTAESSMHDWAKSVILFVKNHPEVLALEKDKPNNIVVVNVLFSDCTFLNYATPHTSMLVMFLSIPQAANIPRGLEEAYGILNRNALDSFKSTVDIIDGVSYVIKSPRNLHTLIQMLDMAWKQYKICTVQTDFFLVKFDDDDISKIMQIHNCSKEQLGEHVFDDDKYLIMQKANQRTLQRGFAGAVFN